MRPARPNRSYELALAIDRWLGRVLCAALLPARRLRREGKEGVRGQVSKVLLIKLWGMGSLVLTSPLVREIRARHPHARIDFLTLRENAALLELYPDLGRRITLDLSRGVPAFLVETLRTIFRVRRERYDLLLDLEFFTRFSAIFAFLVRAGRSHGFSAKGSWRGRLHDVEVPFNGYHHVAENFLTLLRGEPIDAPLRVDLAAPDFLPLLRVPEQKWQSCRQILGAEEAWREPRPLVVVNPNAGDMALERRWPAERMIEFLDGLVARNDVNVVLSGSAPERDYVDSLCQRLHAPERVVNLAGRIDLAQFVALLSRAQVVVTNDSGPLHLAAASGAHAVALFGPETPVLYGPLRSREAQHHRVHYLQLPCSPCMFVHNNKVVDCWFAQARCMTGIRATDVLRSVGELLAPGAEEADPRGRLRVLDS